MTLKELSQVYYLNREIEQDRERLEELRKKAQSPSGSNLSGTFSGGTAESNIERYTAEIIDIETIIQKKITQCLHERKRLERYIADIPDSLTRQIFTLRFVNGLSWNDCAARLGGNNTWKNISNICYRYIESTNNKDFEDNEELIRYIL